MPHSNFTCREAEVSGAGPVLKEESNWTLED